MLMLNYSIGGKGCHSSINLKNKISTTNLRTENNNNGKAFAERKYIRGYKFYLIYILPLKYKNTFNGELLITNL